jgi:hypothetical protein
MGNSSNRCHKSARSGQDVQGLKEIELEHCRIDAACHRPACVSQLDRRHWRRSSCFDKGGGSCGSGRTGRACRTGAGLAGCIVEPVSVNDNLVSGRLPDAKTEIGKSRTETGRRNSRFSAREWELVGARDGVVRANARKVGTFPPSLPTRQNSNFEMSISESPRECFSGGMCGQCHSAPVGQLRQKA